MHVQFTLDGETVRCPARSTVGGALFLLRRRTARLTPRRGERRSLFCGMGVCRDCLMEIDGRPGVPACTTLVRPGMRVATQRGASALSDSP